MPVARTLSASLFQLACENPAAGLHPLVWNGWMALCERKVWKSLIKDEAPIVFLMYFL